MQIQQKKNPVFFSKNIDLKQKTDYWNELVKSAIDVVKDE